MKVLIKVIVDYLELANEAVEMLRQATGECLLVNAWRNGIIEKSGTVNEITYEFHGAGVYLEKKDNWSVEIDFLPGEQLGGFDSWRLWQMIKNNFDKYPGLFTHDDVRVGLQQLLAEGSIVETPNSNLYQLNIHHHGTSG